ncbi:hypothetical protein QYE76_005050 [Lolium multiflorum]|uniref:CCHC-type domain-containing protein n=1 Tax=Lolium multiflorum TaxID=4521 RepID=A0AAD8W0C7_LOLMU|nr:hypothetical protein QYE76_005050 [Lolium multiflorum]
MEYQWKCYQLGHGGELRLSHTNGRKATSSQREPQAPDDEPSGPHHTQKYRNNSSGGFTPRHNKPPAQNYRPNYSNNNGGPPKPGGNHNHHSKNNNSNLNNTNNHPNGNNNNPNNAPKTGSNAVPVNPKDKSTNCYECGVVGHYSNECPKKLARIAANTAAQLSNSAALRRNQNNNNSRLYHMMPLKLRKHPRPCQHAHGGDAERARASLAPVVADLLPSSPSLLRTHPVTCSHLDNPTARASPVADDFVADRRQFRRTPHYADQARPPPAVRDHRDDRQTMLHCPAPSPVTLDACSLASMLDLPRSTTATTRRYKKRPSHLDFFTPPVSTPSSHSPRSLPLLH